MSKQLVGYFLATTFAVYSGILLSSSPRTNVTKSVTGCAFSQQFAESRVSAVDAPLNLTFVQLSEFLLDNYDLDSGDNSTDDWEDRVYDAFWAMQLAELDGQPVPIHRHPYLFVGSVGPTFQLNVLQEYGITHIIGLSQSVGPRFPDYFEYLTIRDVEDSPSANISRYFRPTTRFIEKAKSQNGKVLVHCWEGVSRSVSIIIAHLMKADHIRYKKELQLVRETRPQAEPNSHFVKELKDYEKELFPE